MAQSKAFQDILALLTKITPTETGQLSARLAALRQFGSKAGQTEQAQDQGLTQSDVFNTIMQTLKDNGLHSNPMLREFVTPKFELMLPSILQFLSNAHRERRGQLAILYLGLRLLYEDMAANGIPVTSKTLVEQFYRLPSVLDRHFPGYAKAGLLGFIIDRRI